MEIKINTPPELDRDKLQLYQESVRKYANEAFSNLSPALIERNFLEFAYIHDCRYMCEGCMSLQMCCELTNTAGYIPIPEFEPSGLLHINMRPCQYNPSGVYSKERKKAFTIT